MKKKFLSFVLVFCLIVPCMFMLSACGHEHTYAETWSSNDTHHWHAATCEHTEEKADYAEHVDANEDDICDVCKHGQVAIINGVGYTNLQDAINAAANAEEDVTITFFDDVVVEDEGDDAKLIITDDVTINFEDSQVNLNLPEATRATSNYVGLNVNGGTVVFEGESGGVTTADNGELYAVAVRNGANLTINGGTYIGGTTAVNVVQGTLTINGGFFQAQTEDTTFTLNCIDANYNNDTANIIVKGGTFVNFNPADNEAETGDHINFVADGYTVISETQANGDVWYTVVAE